jgi:hypothetical protein
MKLPNSGAVRGSGDDQEKFETLSVPQKIRTTDHRMQAWQIDEAKDFKNYVKRVERIVRGSMEYRDYVHYVGTGLDISRCSFIAGADPKEHKGVKIEMHHAILTLYDVTSAVVRARCVKGGPATRISPYDIADEILKCHYENIIPLVPLSNTAHKLVHSGDLFITADQVFGDMRTFVNRYREGFDDEQLIRLRTLLDVAERMERIGACDRVPEALERTITIVEMEGMRPLTLEDLVIENREATA